MTVKGEIILELLEAFPLEPSRTIARIAFDKNPKVFTTIEDARDTVRYYRGTKGDELRKNLKDGKYKKIWESASVTIPEPVKEEREDFILPKVNNNVLLLSDIHVPYHDKGSLEIAVNWAKTRGVNTVLLLGDIIDFFALSSFMKDPRKINFAYELDVLYEVIYWIADQLPNAKIYYLPGNHEFRYERYMVRNAPVLLDTDEWGLNNLLKLHELGVEYLRYKQLVRMGGLIGGHGDEVSRARSAVNPARGFFLRAKTSYIGGHFHTPSNHSESNLRGESIKCWSMGCLCGLTPDWNPYNNWKHGFARVRIDGDNFDVFNAEINNGRITG